MMNQTVLQLPPEVTQATGGGPLVKAQLVPYEKVDGTKMKDDAIVFFLNPRSIVVEKELQVEHNKQPAGMGATRVGHAHPLKLSLGEVYFDTYGVDKRCVRERFIDRLESLLDNTKDAHPPALRFFWGKFVHHSRHDLSYVFYLTKLKVEYTMFLTDGTPVRAKCQLDLTQATAYWNEKTNQLAKQDPDMPVQVTTKGGDTLQALSAELLGDPKRWREIAEANDIDDPMNVPPGLSLIVPGRGKK